MQDYSQGEDVIFVVVGGGEVVVFRGAVGDGEAGLVVYIKWELLLSSGW